MLGALGVLTTQAACERETRHPGNLLHGLVAVEHTHVAHPERLTDGLVPRDGDAWRSNLSAELRGSSAKVVFDLGRDTSIEALMLIGDNNDRFDVSLSDDGKRFTPLWSAPAVAGAGMQTRAVRDLAGRGRYLRVAARGGDAFVSLGEVLAFAKAPEPFPPALARTASGPVHAEQARMLALLGVLIALSLLACHVRVPVSVTVLVSVLTLAFAIDLARRLLPLWPFHEEIVSALRVVLALVGALGLLLGRLRVRHAPLTGWLALCALLSLACFYNFGRPWFWDFTQNRPTPVHSFDMRVYYPVAKYFHELRFDGLYFASVAAYLQGEERSAESIADVDLRDLRTNQMVKVRDVLPEIERVHQRFSPERWRAFLDDMRFFWTSMGRDYLSTLRDHGGNATPAWLAVAHLLFMNTTASERVLTLTGLFDPLLLFALLLCIARSFGRYTALACAIVFGATDFPMLGSNWAGATLRFDWMTALGFAACAFRTQRYGLGGALLGYAAMMRAFPVLSLALLGGALCVRIGWSMARERVRPTWSWVRQRHAPALRALTAALLTMTALFALSVGLFGLEAGWGQWAHKIAIHNEKSNTNHVGLRTVLSYHPQRVAHRLARVTDGDPWQRWHQTQVSTFEARKPLFYASALLFVVAAMLACAFAPLEQAAVLGLLLVPVLSYPANYYLHAVYLLPLLAGALGRVRGYFVELVVLMLCAAQYWTLGITHRVGSDERFAYQSMLLLAATVLVIGVLLTAPAGLRAFRAPPAQYSR